MPFLQPRPTAQSARRRSVAAGGEPKDWRRPLRPTEPACCCPGWAQYRVVLPAVPDRPHPTDLLLCAHHYRLYRPRLAALGASAYDASGTVASLNI